MRKSTFIAALSALLTLGAGCKSFLDPSEVGRYEKDPLTVKILDQIDPAVEAPDPEFVNATLPTQDDLTVDASDYRITAGDTLTISVADLVGTGAETIMTRRVSESGNVSLQLLREPVAAEGMTEIELQQRIADAYRDANIITDAQVSVIVADRQGATFNIFGAVSQPGRYPVPEADFRLIDALVMAQDVTAAVGIEDIYIIRKTGEGASQQQPAAQPTTTPRRNTGEDPLAPQSQATPDSNPVKNVALFQAETSQQPRARQDDERRYTTIDGRPVEINPDGSSQAGQTTPRPRSGQSNFAFNAPSEPTDRRVIRIPWIDLQNGNLKYNVVIKPEDTIYVPQPVVGEYYMGGHVSAPGAYSLSGRKITLTQAVIAARMLDPLAIPARTEIRRRIDDNEVLIARVDLEKIFNGEAPDIYLKKDDSVSVGTNAIAPFLLAVRNGFRVAYGFGFLYDRNFYDDDDDRFNN